MAQETPKTLAPPQVIKGDIRKQGKGMNREIYLVLPFLCI